MSRMVTLNLAVVTAIGVVLWSDADSTLLGQAALGVATSLLLALFLARAPSDDRRIVVWCVVVSTAAELFCTQVWGLYRYRFGNVPLYVPPGHGLLCLASLETARSVAFSRHGRRWLALITALTLAWAALGLFASSRPDVEGALYLPIFLPLVVFTRRRLEHGWTFVLASLVELWGTRVHTWEWSAIQPWLEVPAANPPSVAAGGYCTFTCAALGCVWLVERARGRARDGVVASR